MAFSQTTRFGLWKIDTGTVDQTSGDKVKENTDTIDANLGKSQTDAGDSTAGFLSQKMDTVSLDVDTGAHKVYAKHGRLVYNLTNDADYTLTTGQHRYPILVIADPEPYLTTGRNIIVPTETRIWWFENATAQPLTVKTSAGSGVSVPSGNRVFLHCNGTNVVALSGSGGGGGGDMDKADYDPANISEQVVGVSAVQAMTNKRIRYPQSTITSSLTVGATHESSYIYGNNTSNIVITLPPNSGTALPVGYEFWVVTTNTGGINISPDSGVTLNGAGSPKSIATGFNGAHIRKVDTNAWIMVGA